MQGRLPPPEPNEMHFSPVECSKQLTTFLERRQYPGTPQSHGCESGGADEISHDWFLPLNNDSISVSVFYIHVLVGIQEFYHIYTIAVPLRIPVMLHVIIASGKLPFLTNHPSRFFTVPFLLAVHTLHSLPQFLFLNSSSS